MIFQKFVLYLCHCNCIQIYTKYITMSKADIIPTLTRTYSLREWNAIPQGNIGNSFFIKDNSGKDVCILIFPGKFDPNWVDLITATPELKIVAEICLRLLEDNKASKNNRLLEMVREVVRRVK